MDHAEKFCRTEISQNYFEVIITSQEPGSEIRQTRNGSEQTKKLNLLKKKLLVVSKDIRKMLKIANTKKILSRASSSFRILGASANEFENNVSQVDEKYPSVRELEKVYKNCIKLISRKKKNFLELRRLLQGSFRDVLAALNEIDLIEKMKEDLLRDENEIKGGVFGPESGVNRLINSQDSVFNLNNKEQSCLTQMWHLNKNLTSFYSEKIETLKEFKELLKNEYRTFFFEFKAFWKEFSLRKKHLEKTQVFPKKETLLAGIIKPMETVPKSTKMDFLVSHTEIVDLEALKKTVGNLDEKLESDPEQEQVSLIDTNFNQERKRTSLNSSLNDGPQVFLGRETSFNEVKSKDNLTLRRSLYKNEVEGLGENSIRKSDTNRTLEINMKPKGGLRSDSQNQDSLHKSFKDSLRSRYSREILEGVNKESDLFMRSSSRNKASSKSSFSQKDIGSFIENQNKQIQDNSKDPSEIEIEKSITGRVNSSEKNILSGQSKSQLDNRNNYMYMEEEYLHSKGESSLGSLNESNSNVSQDGDNIDFFKSYNARSEQSSQIEKVKSGSDHELNDYKPQFKNYQIVSEKEEEKKKDNYTNKEEENFYDMLDFQGIGQEKEANQFKNPKKDLLYDGFLEMKEETNNDPFGDQIVPKSFNIPEVNKKSFMDKFGSINGVIDIFKSITSSNQNLVQNKFREDIVTQSTQIPRNIGFKNSGFDLIGSNLTKSQTNIDGFSISQKRKSFDSRSDSMGRFGKLD